jgi:fatty acid desaturase
MKRNVNDFRLNTRSVEINSIIKLFYGNMNYHLEHHLFPKLPYYNMGLARQVLKDKKFIKDVKIKGFREILKVIYDK